MHEVFPRAFFTANNGFAGSFFMFKTSFFQQFFDLYLTEFYFTAMIKII